MTYIKSLVIIVFSRHPHIAVSLIFKIIIFISLIADERGIIFIFVIVIWFEIG
jgi:hypothetical protein